MPGRAFEPSDLAVGRVLPRDAYDDKGKLLLRRGQLIRNPQQLEILTRALFPKLGELTPDMPPPPSVLAMVLDVRRRLQLLLASPAAEGFVAEVRRMALSIRRACAANADVALGTLLLCPDGPYAARHATNAAICCQLTGTALGLADEALADIVAAALTMNIAMSGLQDRLQTQEQPLDEAQHASVQAHCGAGVEMLRALGVDSAAWLDAVADHHERCDGSGYPAGKRDDALGLGARLLAVADVYCARVAGRDYRPPLQPTVALRWLFLNEGTALDEQLAKLFIKTLGVYPPGTGVRLRNGSIAVVIQRGASGHLPTVASLTTHDGMRAARPIRRRNDVDAHAICEVVDLRMLDPPVSMEALWGADASA